MLYRAIKTWVGEPIALQRRSSDRAVNLPMADRRAPPILRLVPPTPRATRWPALRTEAVEALWGAHFTSPGGAVETIRLAAPIGLTPESSLLLLGGGLGGPARAINTAFGAHVESLEADPDLAEAAASRMPPNTGIRTLMWHRDTPAFQPRSADHALSLEAARGASVGSIVDGLAAALRPGAHIVMTELVADNAPPEHDREFAAWCRLEDRGPTLPRRSTVTEALRRHFELRAIEDLSQQHTAHALAGWRASLKRIAAGVKPDTAAAARLVSEAELWLLRIRLMRRFGLRLLSWHAVAAA